MYIEIVGYIAIKKQDYEELYSEITIIDPFAQLYEEAQEIQVSNSEDMSSFIKNKLDPDTDDKINQVQKFIIHW